MLTLEETLSHQNNLAEVCAERPLRTREVFAPNAFYGIDGILKRYCRLPRTYSLKVVVPHGVVLSETHVWEAEQEAHLPVVLCYPPYRKRTYVSQTNKKVILSASPFVYVVEMLRSQPGPARRGTIFFPQHSTHHVTAEMDFERLAQELSHLDDQHKPITVCIYWRDFNLGRHIPFQKKGMRIVSAGHMYDPDFLFRFYHLCSMHLYSAGNGMGSQIFYSVKSGCSYFHFDKVRYSLLADKHTLKRDVAPPPRAREVALKSLFRQPQSSMTAEQLNTVDYYLGTEYLKSPTQLRQQLLYAEVLDKVGFVARTRAGTVEPARPAYWHRAGCAWRQTLSNLWMRTTRAS